MPTTGGASGSNGAVIIVSRRRESVPVADGDRLRQPGGAAREQHERVEVVVGLDASRRSRRAAAEQLVGAEHHAVDRVLERVSVRLAGDADGRCNPPCVPAPGARLA